MALSTVSGPWRSFNGFIFPSYSAAVLGNKASAVNTVGKVVGKSVVDIATGIIYTATGTTDTAAWKGSDASTITPA